MSKLITYAQLKAKGACTKALGKFKSLFGDEITLTQEIVEKHFTDFDIGWAASNLLNVSAFAEYKRISAPAFAEYNRILAHALAEYKRKCAFTFFELYNAQIQR